jgi:hypothetical protein
MCAVAVSSTQYDPRTGPSGRHPMTSNGEASGQGWPSFPDASGGALPIATSAPLLAW